MDSPFFHGITCFKDIINSAGKTQYSELILRKINHDLGAVGKLLRFRLNDAYNAFRPSVHTQYAGRVVILKTHLHDFKTLLKVDQKGKRIHIVLVLTYAKVERFSVDSGKRIKTVVWHRREPIDAFSVWTGP